MTPREITQFSDTALSITWEDGHESIYVYEDLRSHCPCAGCNQQRLSSKGKPSFKRFIPINVNNPDIMPRRIEPIGQYALRFYWSDRHSAGIYTFAFLRELCSCDKCAGN